MTPLEQAIARAVAEDGEPPVRTLRDRAEMAFRSGQDVWRKSTGEAVHILAVCLAVDHQRPYCVAPDPEHAEQSWVAESDLMALEGAPVAPVSVLTRPGHAFRPTGDFGEGESRPELHRSRLLGGVVINGLDLSVEAWEVEAHPQGGQRTVHPDLREDFDLLYRALAPDGVFRTVAIEGREYVIIAFPGS